mgnify:CR=1 FL=1
MNCKPNSRALFEVLPIIETPHCAKPTLQYTYSTESLAYDMPALLNLEPTSVSSRRWAALRSRDPSANSAFFYGVTSTLIFCRPTCPARLARRSNIVYFDDVSAARDAGYRPCKRCDPYNTSWHREMRSKNDLTQAQNLIAIATVEGKDWSVAEIAAKVGVSIGHLHRLFKKYANTTQCSREESRFTSSESLGFPLIVPESVVSQSTLEPLLWFPWDRWSSDLEQYVTAEPSDLFEFGDAWTWLAAAEPFVQLDERSPFGVTPDQISFTTI